MGTDNAIRIGQSGTVGVIYGGITAFNKRAANAILIGVPLAGSAACPFWFACHPFTWIDAVAFLIGYAVIGFGVGIGLHRYFSHRSFVPRPWLAWCLGAAGSMAFQGSVLRWVADHRRHHARTDACGDVHSPAVDSACAEPSTLRGMAHAHVGWMFDRAVTDIKVFGKDLLQDRMVMFFHRTHWAWPVLSLLAPWAWGYALGGREQALGCLLFAGCLRTTVFHNVVWAVNSIGHKYGYQSYATGDGSRNNAILAWAAFGEGWHNNHHRFPRSAIQGLAPHELDLNGMVILGLQRLGAVQVVIRAPTRR